MSRYTLWVTPEALREIKDLPGHIRQRVKRAINGLPDNPRPPESQTLPLPGFECELRRLRLDRWRVVYTITEAENTVDVLAVRKRPPYDYGDLQGLLTQIRSAS